MSSAVLMSVVGGMIWAIMLDWGRAAPARGGLVLEVMSFFLLLFCLFEGIRSAAGGICEERREGTLGLLFLTDLTGFDVLLGKLSGSAISAFYSVVAVFPVLGLAVLFGGVTGSELVRMAAALLVAMSLSLSCGLWASTRGRDGLGAILWALGLLVGVCLVPVVLDFAVFPGAVPPRFPRMAVLSLASPLTGFALVGDRVGAGGSGRLWASLAVQLVLSALLVSAAVWHLRRTWRRDEAFSETGPGPGTSGSRRGRAPDLVAAVVSHRMRLGRWGIGLAVLTLLGGIGSLASSIALRSNSAQGGMVAQALVMQLPLSLIGLTRILLLIWLAARVFSEARQTGEMEILLTTGVSNRRVVEIVWSCLRRLLVRLFLLELLMACVQWISIPLLAQSNSDYRLMFGVQLVSQQVTEWLLWVAMTWVALWFGLTGHRTGPAVGKTFGLVVVGTYFIGMIVLQFGFSLLMRHFPDLVSTSVVPEFHFVSHQVLTTGMLCLLLCAWIRWARARLFNRFRQAAAEIPE